MIPFFQRAPNKETIRLLKLKLPASKADFQKLIPDLRAHAFTDYKPGDLPPKGYVAWHEWADVQRKAGIRQVKCCMCALWKSPQELSGRTVKWVAHRGYLEINMESPVCSQCAARPAEGE